MEIQFLVLDGNYFHSGFLETKFRTVFRSISIIMILIRETEELKEFWQCEGHTFLRELSISGSDVVV